MDDEKFINLAIKASHLKMQEEVTELLRKAYEEEKNLEQEQTERKVHMPSQIDMHMHSTSSDGKDTPAQLWEKIKALGIKTFALTDHDAIDGVKDMEHLVSSEKDGSVRFIGVFQNRSFRGNRSCCPFWPASRRRRASITRKM